MDAGVETLEAVPGIYALGDCCSPVEMPLPALAQVTGLKGAHVMCTVVI